MEKTDYAQMSIFDLDLFGDDAEPNLLIGDYRSAEQADTMPTVPDDCPKRGYIDVMGLEGVYFRTDRRKHNLVIRKYLSTKTRELKWRVLVDDAKTIGYNTMDAMCDDWNLSSEEIRKKFGEEGSA